MRIQQATHTCVRAPSVSHAPAIETIACTTINAPAFSPRLLGGRSDGRTL